MELSNAAISTLTVGAFSIAFLLIFRTSIKAFLAKATKIEFKLLGLSIHAPVQEFLNMFEKMHSKLLKPTHIQFYCEIVKSEKSPTVQQVISGFDRGSKEWVDSEQGKEAIGMLRALRGLGFIEPREKGRWEAETHIVITEFGREMYRHMKA